MLATQQQEQWQGGRQQQYHLVKQCLKRDPRWDGTSQLQGVCCDLMLLACGIQQNLVLESHMWGVRGIQATAGIFITVVKPRRAFDALTGTVPAAVYWHTSNSIAGMSLCRWRTLRPLHGRKQKSPELQPQQLNSSSKQLAQRRSASSSQPRSLGSTKDQG